MPNGPFPPSAGPPPKTTFSVVGQDDWVNKKQRGWEEDLSKAIEERDSLKKASIQVLTKRNEEAQARIKELEELNNKKDERIMQLVDIIIKKLGGFDVG